MNTAQCEICCLVRPLSEMDRGDWGYYCSDDPECRQPLTRPRQRDVATLTTEILDRLESHADHGQTYLTDAEVVPAVLRALIDAARREMRRDAGLQFALDVADRVINGLRAQVDALTAELAACPQTRHVYFFEPCADRKVLIGRYTTGGAYVSAGMHVERATWLTAPQRAAIRAIDTRLSAGDDPREISPQIRVVLHGA